LREEEGLAARVLGSFDSMYTPPVVPERHLDDDNEVPGMTRMEVYPAGVPCFVDTMTDDVAAAQRF